jgi:hypothetical protein
VEQFTLDHPEVDPAIAAGDAQLAVGAFTERLLKSGGRYHDWRSADTN